ncbi:MAG: NAD(P)-binding protein [Candidatus Peribacteraceae bacterium]|nr:NAD(P)-binding protein [Candidatus Peribacteraceae bacterium]
MASRPEKGHVNVKNLILGGGVAGLSLQYFLDDKDNTVVLERSEDPGGGCKSVNVNGTEYFLGPRKLRVKDETIGVVSELLDDLGIGSKELINETSLVRFKREYIPFPLQDNLIDLGLVDRLKTALSWSFRPQADPRNFEEWAIAKYGKFMAEEFLLPHSEKCWKRPAKEIMLKASQKVAGGSTMDFIQSLAFGNRSEDLRILIEGGVNSIVSGIVNSDRSDVWTGVNVSRDSLNVLNKHLYVGSMIIHYENLINTIPLPAFQHILTYSLDNPTQMAFEVLDYNILSITFFAIKKDYYIGPENVRMIYYPDENCVFNRISFPDVDTVTEIVGFKPMTIEVSLHRRYKRLLRNDYFQIQLFGKIIQDLVEQGLILERLPWGSDSFEYKMEFVNPGYIMFDQDYEWATNEIMEHFKKRDIHFLGRFAQWNNLEIDTTIKQAQELAEELNGR